MIEHMVLKAHGQSLLTCASYAAKDIILSSYRASSNAVSDGTAPIDALQLRLSNCARVSIVDCTEHTF